MCRLRLGFALLMGELLLVACEAPPDLTPTPFASPTVLRSPTPTPVHVPIHVVVCIDRSGSYQDWTQPAISAIADLLPELIAPGPGWRFDFRWIQSNSYEPGAHIDTLELPALPRLPAPPPTITPWPTPENPLERYEPTRAFQATQQAEQERQFRDEQDRIRAQHEEARRKAQAFADRLRRLQPQVAERSDIWGCFIKAAELFQTRPASARWLIVASDLEEAGRQQQNALRLPGVHVRIVFWKAREAKKAQRLQDQWTRALMEAGAADVRFTDPSQGLDLLQQELIDSLRQR